MLERKSPVRGWGGARGVRGCRVEQRGAEQGAEQGTVPVLGAEEGFLIRLRPDELVSPACKGRTGSTL